MEAEKVELRGEADHHEHLDWPLSQDGQQELHELSRIAETATIVERREVRASAVLDAEFADQHQYSSGRRIVVTLRSASVMIQTRWSSSIG